MSWKWLSRSVCHAPIELLARPRLAPSDRRREQLGVVQRPLRAPARPLGARLASCRCRGGTRGRARRRPPATAPPPPARAKNASGSPIVVRGTPCRSSTRASVSSISRRRPAAAVAPAEQSRLRADRVVVLEVARRAAQLGDGRLGVVGVGRREVREHRRAVDPDPAEGVVLGRVEPVPGELLREEAVDPGAAHDLRQLAVVAEHVGVPEHATRGGRARARRSAGRAGTGARATRRRAGCSPARPRSRRPAATARRRRASRIRAHSPGASGRGSTRTAGPASRRSGSRGSAP